MTVETPTRTASALPDADGRLARAGRAAMRRALASAALIALGIGGMYLLEEAYHLTFNKPPMPLRKPLNAMDRRLGGGRYVAEGPDENMEEDIVQVLGTKDYLLRTYTDMTKKPGAPGQQLKLNLNYYASGSSTPHVPEICWAGAGMNEAPESRQIFEVKNVRRADGHVENVRMRLISFIPQQDSLFFDPTAASSGAKKFLNVAYLFEVNGNCVATPREVLSEFWKASNPHAYHTKIEVTVPEVCTQAEAEKVISDFVRDALPAVEECLPLKEQPAESGSGKAPLPDPKKQDEK